MAHKALCKIMLYKALKIPLIRPRKSLYSIYNIVSRSIATIRPRQYIYFGLYTSAIDIPTVLYTYITYGRDVYS